MPEGDNIAPLLAEMEKLAQYISDQERVATTCRENLKTARSKLSEHLEQVCGPFGFKHEKTHQYELPNGIVIKYKTKVERKVDLEDFHRHGPSLFAYLGKELYEKVLKEQAPKLSKKDFDALSKDQQTEVRKVVTRTLGTLSMEIV